MRILANFTNYLKSATIIPHADAALVNGSRIYLSANADQVCGLALQVLISLKTQNSTVTVSSNQSLSSSGLVGNSSMKSVYLVMKTNISLSVSSTGSNAGLVTNVSNNLTLTL